MPSAQEPLSGQRFEWGGDTRTEPLPPVSRPIADRAVSNGRIAVMITIVAWVAFMVTTIVQQFVVGLAASPLLKTESIMYMVIVTLLTLSSISYLICRLGFFYRTRLHRRVSRASIDAMLATKPPSVAVLIPSYEEDQRYIYMTALSAALQEYPKISITLLIDDNPLPRDRRRRDLLVAARQIPTLIDAELSAIRRQLKPDLKKVRRALRSDTGATLEDQARLAAAFETASAWLRDTAAGHERIDHVDVFFADHVLGSLAADLDLTASALTEAGRDGVVLGDRRLAEIAQRLDSIFSASLGSFERKTYSSLSHAANKAMNLNSYLSLMGESFAIVETPSGRILKPAKRKKADIVVADPDYVVTLDADSVLLPEYVARMVYLLERRESSRIAVAQTPYSSYPGAGTRLERIAGATTDIQHIAHQGLTHHDATFWVGANAVIRKRALDDIVVVQYQGDHQVRTYIRDRTVIEDTESTMDLRINGWQLVNYPERLSYSATPPDFGSLSIQRRRWADGGLLIAPKLWRQSRALKEGGEQRRFSETLLRLSYMASIFWSTVCLLLIVAFPFNATLLSPLVILVALPYFWAMANDLRYCGYRRSDVLRTYGFNLLLIPVNLAGVFNSMLQGVTGEKVAFKRTPKIRKRTPPGLFFVLTPYLFLGLSIWTAFHAFDGRHWENFAFAALNGVLLVYAIVAFMGLTNSLADLWASLTRFLYVPVTAEHATTKPPSSPEATDDEPAWGRVLDIGVVPSAPSHAEATTHRS